MCALAFPWEAILEIDGSYGEGGGQVLRTALTLSALTGRPTRVHHIRAGRRKPGLAPQHLTGVLALAQVCAADVQGAAIGSTQVVFQPRSTPHPGTYIFDVAHAASGGSAGAVSLLFQTLVFPLVFATSVEEPSQGSPCASRLTLKGGTHVPWSPPFEYLARVYLPTLARLGVRAECRLEGCGFYPVGGGQVRVQVISMESPDGAARALAPLTLSERGRLKRVWGTAIACNLPAHIAQRIANRAHNVLSSAGVPGEVKPRLERGPGPGAALCLVAEYEHALAGFSALGAKGKPSEQVADEACQDLLVHHADGAPVDPHLADQLLLPLALAAGRSEFRTSRVTQHLLTNAHVIRQFIPVQIEIGGGEGEPGAVVVRGAGGL